MARNTAASATSGEALPTEEAIKSGVPVYSIGVGFGFDRTYLQGISSSTNAQTYESPTSEELTQIYTDLAAKLRSQYVITLNVPLPLDGTQYNLGLAVTTSEGSADATAVLRAPIPTPIVRLPDPDAIRLQRRPTSRRRSCTTTRSRASPSRSTDAPQLLPAASRTASRSIRSITRRGLTS